MRANESTVVSFIREEWPAPPGATAPLDLAPDTVNALALEDGGGRVGLLLRTAQQVSCGVAPAEDLRSLPQDDATVLKKVLERSGLLSSRLLAIGAVRAHAVCGISVRDGVDYRGERGSWTGTGFLVSPSILLTTHHVLNSRDTARRASCAFAGGCDAAGDLQPPHRFGLNPGRLFVTSRTIAGLDFTFVWVDGMPGARFGFVPLERAVTTVARGEIAKVLHPADGLPQAVAPRKSVVVRQDQVVVHYATHAPANSGSPVFNGEWRLIALHHASPSSQSRPAAGTGECLNEGIKPSAIAAHLERAAETGDSAPERDAARELLALFRGSDELAGYFGTLGRSVDGRSDVQRVVDGYRGEREDVDVGFWNVEGLDEHDEERVEAVARVVLTMNLDVWAFFRCSPRATAALVDCLNGPARQRFAWAASDPGAPSGTPTTTVVWNERTVDGGRHGWPAEIDARFTAGNRDRDGLDPDAVGRPCFPRYPGLFLFRARGCATRETFAFHLVPLSLSELQDGSKRRMATAIVAAAVQRMIATGADGDWVVGGEFDAELATRDFGKVLGRGHVALGADDRAQGAVSVVKGPWSPVDHVFLSPGLMHTFGSPDLVTIAADERTPDWARRMSAHRPVLVRLSLGTAVGRERGAREPDASGLSAA